MASGIFIRFAIETPIPLASPRTDHLDDIGVEGFNHFRHAGMTTPEKRVMPEVLIEIECKRSEPVRDAWRTSAIVCRV
jgi:hypothetical protein